MEMEEKKREQVTVLAVAGMLGSSFDETGFREALMQNPDMIGCDSGTCDSGPFYAGAGVPRMSRKAVKRDLTLMIRAGLERGIPVIVGSAGPAGADPNVDWMIGIVKEIAKENDFHFRLGEIKTEITKEQLKQYMEEGRFHALEGAPDFSEKDMDTLTRCISVIGAEPYNAALDGGAQVIIAGRSTDTAIYACVPIRYGFDNAFAWHAAKTIECGTLATVFEKKHGAMLASVRKDSASIWPGHPDMAASPVSVVSHTLYENANPYILTEPGGILHTKDSVYTAENERVTRITGSTMEKKPYTVKLEGVKFEGYRRVALAGVSDPLILKQLYSWLETVVEHSRAKIRRGLGLAPDEYRLRYVVYGNPDDPCTERVGVMFDIIARNEEDAGSIITNVWHTMLHVPIPEWEGGQSQTAFPFSPPDLQTQEGGKTYSICLNHVVEVQDPLETCRIRYYDL